MQSSPLNLKKQMQYVEIYTDGGAHHNPGPGAWAAILYWNGHEKSLSGYEPHTTNNRMELMAAIKGLQALKKPCQVKLMTDSKYVIDGMTQWIHAWKSRGWKTAGKNDVFHQELWQDLDHLAHMHRIEWVWVKGHNGNPGNEAADALVQETIDKGQGRD